MGIYRLFILFTLLDISKGLYLSYILYQMSVANPPIAFEPKEFLRACDYLGELNFIIPSPPVFV